MITKEQLTSKYLYSRLPLTCAVLDKLGFEEYWDENCTWGGRSLYFKDGTYIRIMDIEENDDINEGYGDTIYMSDHYYYTAWFDNNEDRSIGMDLFFIDDLYDVISVFHKEHIDEFLELCKRENIIFYINEYLNAK